MSAKLGEREHLRFDSQGRRVIQCWCGEHDLYSTSETVRTSRGQRHGFTYCYPVAPSLAEAPQAPKKSTEGRHG